MGLTKKDRERTLWDDGNVIYFNCGGSHTTVYTYQNLSSYKTERENFIVYKLILIS